MTFIKVCGITNLNDALLAASLGVYQIGFNFYHKSPRFVSTETAASISRRPDVTSLKVGVFVDEKPETIASIADVARLDAIQLHGSEDPCTVATIRRLTRLKIIKAFRVSHGFEISSVAAYDVDAVLLDAFSASEFGGTGDTFDWEIAKKVRDIVPELYLAGGISEENVARAIASVDPFCVDACSRLESVKGIKDELKLRRFVKNAGIKR